MKMPSPVRQLFFAASICVLANTSVHATLPNIVIIFTDDIGYGDISSLNPSSGFETPAISALAKEGITFHQAHSSSGICSPSRYSLLTGNRPYRGRENNGVWTHASPSQIRPGQTTIADLLRDHKYRSAFIGKSHIGGQFYKRSSTQPASFLREVDVSQAGFDGPKDHGFDYTLTLHAGLQHAPYAYFENDRLSRWNPASNKFYHFETEQQARQHFRHIAVNGQTEESLTNIWWENYEMDNFDSAQAGPLLTFAALNFIDQHIAEHAGRPFFLLLATTAAHYPFTPPVDLSPDDPDDYMKPGKYPIKGMTPSDRSDMVYESNVITQVLVDKLKARNIYDDTIIIYTSDNGPTPYWESWSHPEYFTFKWGAYGGNRVDRTDSGREGMVVNPQGVSADGKPLKGQKGYISEGGHRVPLIIAMGKNIVSFNPVRGYESQQLVALHDLYATLCDLLEIKVPDGQAIDSVSFADVLSGKRAETKPVREWLQIQASIPQASEQEGAKLYASQHKLGLTLNDRGIITGLAGKGAPSNASLMFWLESKWLGHALYHQESGKRWKLTFQTHAEDLDRDIIPRELFELVSDPTESINLIDDEEQKSRIAKMQLEYLRSLR